MSYSHADRGSETTPQQGRISRPGTTPASDGVDDSRDHRLRWPGALAITVALGFAGALAAGWFDPMLPWLN